VHPCGGGGGGGGGGGVGGDSSGCTTYIGTYFQSATQKRLEYMRAWGLIYGFKRALVQIQNIPLNLLNRRNTCEVFFSIIFGTVLHY